MADKTRIETTSSTTLDGRSDENSEAARPKPSQAPKCGGLEEQILTKLVDNLSQSYRIVKQRQQKYNELSVKPIGGTKQPMIGSGCRAGQQEICPTQNKLKRKKQLSSSLTSVTDSVNQEKRTRIEGIQLNCRGKLHINTSATGAGTAATKTSRSTSVDVASTKGGDIKRAAVKTAKPSSTPTSLTLSTEERGATVPSTDTTVKMPPPRLKRKLQENVQTIQRLNALTEQLRLEINELKSSLTTERGAVRVLRAQNESETRKWKAEVKKLQNSLELLKKSSTLLPHNSKKSNEGIAENPVHSATNCLVNYEIQRLTHEITALKEANRALEEKKVINCDADRRKAADMRTLKDSYEIRLTQLTKSAKTEISRLLEEIKAKERSIGQLKKDLLLLQGKPTNEIKSRNATTNQTTNKSTNNKPKKSNAIKLKQINETTNTKNVNIPQKEDNEDLSHVQHPNEVKKLKDIERINNNKNLQHNVVNLKTTAKILTITNSQNSPNSQNSFKLRSLENINDNQNQNHNHQTHSPHPHHGSKTNLQRDENHNNLLKITTTTKGTIAKTLPHREEFATVPIAEAEPQPESESVVPLKESLLAAETKAKMTTATATTTTTTTTAKSPTAKEQNCTNEFRGKDNSSDSDSALSSAPPSISPQPPPAGLETTDIWQMIRTYTTDIEKLQKDVEMVQNENEQLHAELSVAKEQIKKLEKSAEEANNSTNSQQLLERIKSLEDQERQLQTEAEELREQNELLEFRILELEEPNDKWSIQSHATSSAASSTPTTTNSSLPTTKDVWAFGGKCSKEDPMQMLFGSHNATTDSGITSPQSHQHMDDELNAMDVSSEELRQRITNMIHRRSLNEEDRQCLQHILALMPQLDLLSQRSGPNSFNTTSCSSDDASSLDLVKSRVSDYSSASSSSSVRLLHDNVQNPKYSKSAAQITNSSRIVATVQPYNSSPQPQPQSQQQQQSLQQQHLTSHHQQQQQSQQQHPVPTNTPNDSPRKSRPAWQSNSLSESGVFVESDFLSDASENHVSTQTDFDDEEVVGAAKEWWCPDPQKQQQQQQQQQQQRYNKVPVPHIPHQVSTSIAPHSPHSPHSNLGDQKRLQYYKERLELLESKLLVYESSGDVQAKHLADRLQREIQLEKQLKELRDRVEFLESENCTLEEEKCEFEEAENDTRLRLQRLEIELEILSQRNVELEMSREALSAKYKDCRSECLILRDDLSVSETQIRHLEEDKQKAKENLEFLHRIIPLFLIYNTIVCASQLQPKSPKEEREEYHSSSPLALLSTEGEYEMGNTLPTLGDGVNMMPLFSGAPSARIDQCCSSPSKGQLPTGTHQQLCEEVKCLHRQLKEMNSRHYEALESADSHWANLERQYKEREEAYRAKERCLKQKIANLQDCVNQDARAANEKIQQMEEAEKELKCCLLRVSKEHRDILEEYQNVMAECDCLRTQVEQLKPVADALEQEKRSSKALNDQINYMRKRQQDAEIASSNDMKGLRMQINDLKKELLQIEVTNSELREEVDTLEQQVQTMQKNETEYIDKVRILTDEVRTKEEMCQKLEKRLERSEGYSLADELSGSSKRFKKEDVKDLKTASKGLGLALKNIQECEEGLPPPQQKFRMVAREVKLLADTLLNGDAPQEENEVSNAAGPEETAGAPRSSGTIKEEAEEGEGEDEGENAVEQDPPQSPRVSVTVGMALVSDFTIDSSVLPTCSFESKKQICEVPSELRKLSTVPFTQCADPPQPSQKKPKRGKCKKVTNRRYPRTLRSRVNRIVSCLNAHRLACFHDVYDLDVSQSEVMQRKVSMDSFHSVKEDQAAAPKIDASTETESSKFDKETETMVEKVESSVQVNDEMHPDNLLNVLPPKSCVFLNMLKSSVSHTRLDSAAFNIKFIKKWEANKEFRDGLEVLQSFSPFDPSVAHTVTADTYELFVNAMSCLHTLEELFKPVKVPVMPQIEDRINDELMNFHTRRMESEFYCTVYYPVKRQVPLNLNDFLVK